MLESELSAKCKKFVVTHWGRHGLTLVKRRPVTWVRHQANPQLNVLRRRKHNLPLIAISSTKNRIHLALSTEKGAAHA